MESKDSVFFNLEEKLPPLNKEVFIKIRRDEELTLIGKLRICVSSGRAYFFLPYNDEKVLLLKEVIGWQKIPNDFFKMNK